MRNHIEAWCDSERIVRGGTEGSIKTYRTHVIEFIRWMETMVLSTAPGDVSRDDVLEFLKHLFFKRNNSNHTRATKLSALRSFFMFLAARGHVSKSPTVDIPSPKFQERAPRKFTDEQLKKLFSAPDEDSPRGLRDRAALMTLYGAGLRKSELTGLDLGDISDTGRHIALRVRGKGGKERTLALRDKPARTLRRWLVHRSGLDVKDTAIFVSLRGRPGRLSSRSVTGVLKKYAKRVGIPAAEAFVHKLRATWATTLYEEGVELIEICKLAGWSNINTAQRYIAISDKVVKKGAISDKRWNKLTGQGSDETGDA